MHMEMPVNQLFETVYVCVSYLAWSELCCFYA